MPADRPEDRSADLPSDLPANLPPDFADELSFALRHTGDTFRPGDSHRLVARGHAHGRRLRRRRTAALTAGVAAFAVIGVGGAVAGGLTKGDADRATAAATPAKPSATAAHHTPRPAPALSEKQVTDLFVSMLPRLPKGGHLTRQPGRGTADGMPLASVVYDDGRGPGLLQLSVGLNESPPEPCPVSDPPGTSCTSRHVHGGTLTILKGFEYPDHRAETKDWYATFVTSSGALIGLSEWNSAQEKDAPVSRPNPPLNSAQLTSIVTDARWQRVIDALPAPVKGPKSAWQPPQSGQPAN